MENLLMIPGPVEIPEDILDEFNGQNVAHYGHEWTNLYLNTVEKTSRFFGTTGMSFIMPGSGSLGLETMAVTFCTGKRCLLIHNGFFADRLGNVVTPHCNIIDILKFGFGKPINLEKLRDSLKQKSYDIVLMVHAETSTGMLNPAHDVSGIVKENGALFLLDAIASGGVEKIDMDKSGIDVVVTASQKGFECPAGLAIVIVQKSLVDDLKSTNSAAWYTDLRIWLDYYDKWNDWHPFPVTLPTNLIKAYAKSLEIIEDEGADQRFQKHIENTSRIRMAFRSLGLSPLIDDDKCTHGLTSISNGGIFESSELIMFMKKTLGIQIAGSLGEYKNVIFRLGHMSRPQNEVRNLISTITGVGLFLKSKGIKVSIDLAIDEIVKISGETNE